MWCAFGKVVDDLDVLPARMEDLEHVLIVGQQVPQRIEIDAVGERIDRGSFFLVADLDQAEFGPVGVLAHELRVHADKIGFFEAFAESCEIVGLGNQVVYFHRTFHICWAECRPRRRP